MPANILTDPAKWSELDAVIQSHKDDQGALMPVLQKAQDIFGYLPIEVQKVVANGLNLTLSDVYGVTTFYTQFILEPRGEYNIGVCLGTACYVRGAQAVLDELTKELDLAVGKTSADGKFTLTATRCLGCCGLAPVMMVGEDVYGRLTPAEIPAIIQKYRDA